MTKINIVHENNVLLISFFTKLTKVIIQALQ